jgi:hypothetical protein
VDVKNKKCEDCELKLPTFGLPAEGKKRWCSGCAKAHAGAVDVGNTKCEGCLLKRARIWVPSPSDGRKRPLCTDCAPTAAT